MAYEVFSLRFLRHVVDDILPLKAFVNGSPVKPAAGSLLIWDEGEFNKTGHIAIITKVYDDKVRIKMSFTINCP